MAWCAVAHSSRTLFPVSSTHVREVWASSDRSCKRCQARSSPPFRPPHERLLRIGGTGCCVCVLSICLDRGRARKMVVRIDFFGGRSRSDSSSSWVEFLIEIMLLGARCDQPFQVVAAALTPASSREDEKLPAREDAALLEPEKLVKNECSASSARLSTGAMTGERTGESCNQPAAD